MAHPVCDFLSAVAALTLALCQWHQSGTGGGGVVAHDSRFKKACRETAQHKQNKSVCCIDRLDFKVSGETAQTLFHMHARGRCYLRLSETLHTTGIKFQPPSGDILGAPLLTASFLFLGFNQRGLLSAPSAKRQLYHYVHGACSREMSSCV